MVVLIDIQHCSMNAKGSRMDLPARQKNTSCNDDMITPASKRSTYSVGRCVIPWEFLGKSVKHIFSC